MKSLVASIVLAVCCALSVLSSFVIPYFEGRRNKLLLVGPLPASFVPFLIALACLVALIVIAVRTRTAYRAIVISGAVLSFLMVALDLGIPKASAFMCGFKDYIQTTITPDELRAIAHKAILVVPQDGKPWERGNLPGPGKWSLWEEAKHRKPWSQLESETAIGKLDNSVTIFVRNDNVSLLWGGALVGHWGVRIRCGTEAKKENIWTAADDITFPISSD